IRQVPRGMTPPGTRGSGSGRSGGKTFSETRGVIASPRRNGATDCSKSLPPKAISALRRRNTEEVGRNRHVVGSLGGVLGLDDQSPRPAPARGLVGERAEDPLRLAVQGIVGGIEVEDQTLRRMSVRGNELIDEDLGGPHRGLALDAVLQPAKGSGGA